MCIAIWVGNTAQEKETSIIEYEEDLSYCGSTQKCKQLRNCSTETELMTISFQTKNKEMIKWEYKTSLQLIM